MADVDYDDGGRFGHPGGWGAPARARRRDAGDHRPDDGGGTGPARGGGLIALLAPGGERIARLVNGAGALTSLALVVGLGLWGYRLAVRDVQGIPVIRALAGAARVAPADPGGDLADHQGLAVNAIAAEGAAAAPAERLVLAPRPAELQDEDLPMGEVQLAAAPPAETGGEAGLTLASADAGAAVPLPVPDMTGADPAAAVALAEGTIDAVVAEAAVAAIPADVPGVARSLRPRLRPADMVVSPVAAPAPGPLADDLAEGGSDPVAEAAAAAVAAALAPADPAEAEIDAASLPAGTRLAQLGAYGTAEEARAEWDQTVAALGPLMEGKKRVVEAAESGGRTFYRLRVEGFADLADARRFCAALKAEGRLCTPAQAQG